MADTERLALRVEVRGESLGDPDGPVLRAARTAAACVERAEVFAGRMRRLFDALASSGGVATLLDFRAVRQESGLVVRGGASLFAWWMVAWLWLLSILLALATRMVARLTARLDREILKRGTR